MQSSSPVSNFPTRYNNIGDLYDARVAAADWESALPKNGSCSVTIGGYRYQVDFDEQSVKETFPQKVRTMFEQCAGRDYVSKAEIKALFFPAKIVHSTNYAIARSVLKHQAMRERGAEAFSQRGLSSSDTKLVRFAWLGQGNFGAVESVVPENSGLMLARKMAKPGGVELLYNECKLLFELNHPNIIGMDEPHSLQGRLVMEYGGVSLTDVIKADSVPRQNMDSGQWLAREDFSRIAKNDGSVRKERMMSIMKQALKGLEYLESEGVLHGDIKPDNILVNPQTGHVCLTDFGISQRLPAYGEGCREYSGSEAYMAPEIRALRANPDSVSYGLAVDMYAAGCTFYEMLTAHTLADVLYSQCGKRDPDSGKLSDLIKAQINPKKMPMLSDADALLMQQLLCGMLDKDPKTRFTPTEALDMLQRVVSGT